MATIVTTTKRISNNSGNNFSTRNRRSPKVTVQSVSSRQVVGKNCSMVQGPRRRGRNRPRKSGSQVAYSAMPKTTLSGVDIIGVIEVQPQRAVGASLFAQAICPTAMSDSRLQQQSKLYSRWRPKKLRVLVVGSGSANTFGSLAIGWSPDPANNISGNDTQNLNRVMACRPSSMNRMNQTTVLNIPVATTRKWYLTKGNPDDANHGFINVVVASTTGGYTGSTTFTVTLEWVIEFEGAELGAVSIDEDITPDTGFQDLFTTSDGSWNSDYLTMKMHHGGQMVPFSAAHQAYVYTNAPGTNVTYYLEDKTTLKTANFFAVIQGYSIPGFVMFASYTDAKDYIRTGDTGKCLKYYTQGPVISPPIPKFRVADEAVQTVETNLLRRIDQLTEQLRAVNAPVTRTVALSKDTAKIRTKLEGMPDGTTLSPFKVISEDPVAAQDFEIV